MKIITIIYTAVYEDYYSCKSSIVIYYSYNYVYNPLFVRIFNRVVSNSFLILSFLLSHVILGLYTFKI